MHGPGSIVRAACSSRSVLTLLAAWLSACTEVPRADAGTETTAPAAGAEADADVHVLGTSESLARVVDMVIQDDGTIWVLNQTEPYFIAFDANGVVQRAWGRQGGGPSEFRGPRSLVVGPDGDVWAFDPGAHGLARVSVEESEPKRIAFPRDSLPPNRLVAMEYLGLPEGPLWLGAAAGRFVLGRSQPARDVGRPLYGSEIVSIGDTGAPSVVLALGDHMPGPPPEFANAALFVPNPLWDVCPEGVLALYDPVQNTVRRLTLDGTETTAAVPLPAAKRLEVTPDRVFGLMYRFMTAMMPADERPDSAFMHAAFEAEFSEASAEMSPVFPEYANIQCTADATIWLQPFNVDGSLGRGPLWLRISGDEVRELRLPERFEPFRFVPGRVYGVTLDELDIPSIAWVEIR
jgi:hypothetical protein